MTTETLDPKDIARSVALMTAEADGQVGGFLTRIDGEDGVSDFRFEADVPGYEHWQWSITLFHNTDDDSWTVDESTLLPGDGALLPPKWIPWKERLLPTDLSVTDALGTDPDDERIEDGVSVDDALAAMGAEEGSTDAGAAGAHEGAADAGDAVAGGDGDDASEASDGAGTSTDSVEAADVAEAAETGEVPASDASDGAAVAPSDGEATAGRDGQDESQKQEPAQGEASGSDDQPAEALQDDAQDTAQEAIPTTDADDIRGAIEAFDLSRRHVLSPLGRAQTAKRWYEGPHGPKSLSTKTASGATCSTCGFFIPLQGDLNRMFGVCANKWSLDDGKVVSLDHGCGEHSEIAPPEPTHLWRQTKPAFDDMRIDIIHQAPREESSAVSIIEDRIAESAEAKGRHAAEEPAQEATPVAQDDAVNADVVNNDDTVVNDGAVKADAEETVAAVEETSVQEDSAAADAASDEAVSKEVARDEAAQGIPEEESAASVADAAQEAAVQDGSDAASEEPVSVPPVQEAVEPAETEAPAEDSAASAGDARNDDAPAEAAAVEGESAGDDAPAAPSEDAAGVADMVDATHDEAVPGGDEIVVGEVTELTEATIIEEPSEDAVASDDDDSADDAADESPEAASEDAAEADDDAAVPEDSAEEEAE